MKDKLTKPQAEALQRIMLRNSIYFYILMQDGTYLEDYFPADGLRLLRDDNLADYQKITGHIF